MHEEKRFGNLSAGFSRTRTQECINIDKVNLHCVIIEDGDLSDSSSKSTLSGWESISETEQPPVNEDNDFEPRDSNCPKNSKYDECNGYPLCQKTCKNYDKIFPCPQICMPGCVCKDDFVKGPDGDCIPIDECPRKSEGRNSIFVS
ncbi:hypothetical protein TNCV_3764321 [Trichonephila clavipes]|uniref:TIL domain-containing protein n=1 Tax=Trichonephila clavipes TaxID=2585209 RepID=A0A8X7B9X1_TRICX|nr:hypothetical protein TNCV_3764321 [Trichonephila clavipes]